MPSRGANVLAKNVVDFITIRMEKLHSHTRDDHNKTAFDILTIPLIGQDPCVIPNNAYDNGNVSHFIFNNSDTQHISVNLLASSEMVGS